MEIMFYGVSFFKIFASEKAEIQIAQFSLSIALFAYNIFYTVRLFVGVRTLTKSAEISHAQRK